MRRMYEHNTNKGSNYTNFNENMQGTTLRPHFGDISYKVLESKGEPEDVVSVDDDNVWSENESHLGSERSFFPLEHAPVEHVSLDTEKKVPLHQLKMVHPCSICEMSFTEYSDLQHHITTHSSVFEGTFQSVDIKCEYHHSHVSQVDVQPVKVKRKSVNFHCNVCNRNFNLKDSFFRHCRIHEDSRPYTCERCGKGFRDSGGLARHLKDVHAGIKNFSCDLCDRKFASKATKEDHRRTHTNERPYICHTCGKTFRSKASLYTHSKIHTNNFPHPCTYCSKRFRRRQEFLAHVTTHTGEKKHSCDCCSKRFRVKGELLRHKLVHSDLKPYICSSCGLSFRQKRYLQNHERSRHKSQEVDPSL